MEAVSQMAILGPVTWRRYYCSNGIFFVERRKTLFIILKNARRVEGAIVPLFNSFPTFIARDLKIAERMGIARCYSSIGLNGG